MTNKQKDKEKQKDKHKVDKWIIFPVIFMIGTYLLVTKTEAVLNFMPKTVSNYVKNDSLSNHLPSIEHLTTFQSFRLGEIYNQNQPNMSEASDLLKSPNLTSAKFELAVKAIKDSVNSTTLYSKIWGAMTFTNTIWTLSIFVCCMTFIPVVKSICGEFLANVFAGLIEILINFYKFGVLGEPLFYLISYSFLVEGVRVDPSVGFYISLTGCVLYFASCMHSFIKHDEDDKYKDREHLIVQLFCSFIIPVAGMMAYHYQSRLLGFITVTAFWQAMGFSVVCFGLCYCIGFDSKKTMSKCVAASSMILPLFALLKQMNYPHEILYPFTSGVYVMGCIVYFLGMLIKSSKWNCSDKEYLKTNGIMILSLVTGLYFGSIYNLVSIYNTSIVFICLFIMEKAFETCNFEKMYIPLFILSLIGWQVSLYLHTHPKFLISLFDTTDILKSSSQHV